MRVLVIGTKPGNISLSEIDGSLESMQAIVGGNIEDGTPAQLRKQRIALMVNEEGILKSMEVNENLWPFFYVGTAFMVGVGIEDLIGLTDEQAAYAMAWLKALREVDK